MGLCCNKVFLLKSKVRTNLVATESNYVVINFPAIEMRFDSNSVAIEKKKLRHNLAIMSRQRESMLQH